MTVNVFVLLSWLAVFAVVWGITAYSFGYKDGRADRRLFQSKPLRLVRSEKRAAGR